MYVCMCRCMTISMYCLYVGFNYTYIDINRGLNPFWPHKFGFKPLLGLEPMALIRPQLPASHANHLATETCMYVCVCGCIYVCICIYVSMHIYIYTEINISLHKLCKLLFGHYSC